MHKKNGKKSKIIQSVHNNTITKFKSEIFERLNIMARRYYLTYLNKDDKDRSMQKTFSNLLFFNNFYIEIKKDVAKCFKQWKIITLKVVSKFSRFWIMFNEDSEHLINLRIHFDLKHKLSTQFQYEWLKKIFTFALSIVNLNRIHRKNRRFLRCKYFFYCQLMSLMLTENVKCFHSVNNNAKNVAIARNWIQKFSIHQVYSHTFIKVLR